MPSSPVRCVVVTTLLALTACGSGSPVTPPPGGGSPSVATVTVTGGGSPLQPGQKQQLSAVLRDSAGNTLTGHTVTWASGTVAVATVSAGGLVTAVAPGTASISATSEGISASVTVTVINPDNLPGSLIEQRVLAQQGLAVALASTVLWSQIWTLIDVDGGAGGGGSCQALDGGGSHRLLTASGVLPADVGLYFDALCTKPYMMEHVTRFENPSAGLYHLVASAAYTGPTGTALGSIAFDENADFNFGANALVGTVNGLGTYTSPSGAPSVHLGLDCNFGDPAATVAVCQGGIAQDFAAVGEALGSVTTLTLDSTATEGVTFTGPSLLTSGAPGSLTLTAPATLSLVVSGGSAYGMATASGAAATFSLFPPPPTGWSVADSTNDQKFSISVVDNAVRNLTGTVTRISTGATLATLALDQSGTGTITYSDGLVAAVTSWMLSQ